MCTYMKLLKNSTVKNVTRLHHRCQVNKCPKAFGKRLHYHHIPVTVNAMHLSGDVLQELDTSPKSARAHGRSGPAPTQQWFLGPTRVSPKTSSWLVQLFYTVQPCVQHTDTDHGICDNCRNMAFSALTLLVGRQEGHPACKKIEWWGAGMVICLELGADLHMAQLMPLPLTVSCFSEIQIGLPFWYRLTRVVPEKGPLNGCVCVCV